MMMFKGAKYKYLIPLIVIIYVITCIYSNGYHHPDEHFQLIEFAGLKVGWNTGENLAWEYDSQIRPTIQVYIVVGIFKLLHFIGIYDPFALSMVLRIVTAVFSICVLFFFIRSFKSTVEEKNQFIWVLLTFFLWFIPSINVRFSSEVWSGLWLLVSIALIQSDSKNKINFFLIGLMFGLSFEFRFQMGLSIAGIFLWLLLIKKVGYRNLLTVLSGLLLIIALCTVLDSIYYGNLVFAPFNYFKIDLIDNVVNSYGLEPWYYYIEKVITVPSILIGPAILLSMYLLALDYKNVILWCIVPYLIVHSLIPHKEIRYLFPIVNFVPLLLVWGYQHLIKGAQKKRFRFLTNGLVILMAVINIGGLFIIFKPAGNGAVDLAAYIHKKYHKAEPIEVYSFFNGPYSIGDAKGFQSRFYMNNEVALHFITSDFFDSIPGEKIIILPVGASYQCQLLETAGYKIERQSIPAWMIFFNRIFPVYDKRSVLLLFTQQNTGKEVSKIDSTN